MSSIEIKNLYKSFVTKDGSVDALSDINLSIEKGKIYGIIGMSGAGKSTLIRCMNYLEVPTQGEVLIDGKALSKLTKKELQKERESIAMIFQHFNLLMQKNVIENVCFPLYIQKMSKSAAYVKAEELLKLVGLYDKKKAYPSMLSGGQKQRVAIARALACNPRILLCDEATSALDPETTSSILELLRNINQRFGITIVIITHQMSVVREICTDVAILENGKVVENGTVIDVFSHPKSNAAKKLLREDAITDKDSAVEKTIENITHGERIRIVFSENSSFEPVIANMILTYGEPVNILGASTRDLAGIAKGEMIIEFTENSKNKEAMKDYLLSRGIEIGEVINNVLE